MGGESVGGDGVELVVREEVGDGLVGCVEVIVFWG